MAALGLMRGIWLAAGFVVAACRDDGGSGGGRDETSATGGATETRGTAGSEGTQPDAGDDSGAGADSDGTGGGTPPGTGDAAQIYPDLVALQAIAINPTCSLNNGVCHNGNNYPDLHTVTNLVSTTWAQCGVEAEDRELIFDVCEPPGDHLVIGSGGLDAEIMSVTVAPADVEDYRDLTSATITIAGDASGVTAGASDVSVTRGEMSFDLDAQGVSVVSVSGDTIELELDGLYGRWSAKRFLDNRTLPWNAEFVREADPNRNGVAGASAAIPMITPGDAWQSYLFLRLVDTQYGDLMPRQCRTWDDRATTALGCWIEGLTTGDNGAPNNALEPIDYEACSLDVEGMGRCEILVGNDLAAIEGIFGAHCGGSGCHHGDGVLAQGLDLTEGNVRGALIDVVSETTGRTLVVPGDPDASYLLCKLTPGCSDLNGSVMPSGGADPLPDAEMAAIREWIAAGATAD